MSARVVTYREDRTESGFELALSCGCNVTIKTPRTLLEFLQLIIDLQNEHSDDRCNIGRRRR